MNYDVIGGSGFIGTRVCAMLERAGGSSVRIIDKAPSAAHPSLHVYGDVRSIDDLRDSVRQGGVLINLAAEHRDDVRPANLYYDVNVDGAANICEIAAERGTRTILFTSTVAVYGAAASDADELTPPAPTSDYGISKYKAEEVFRNWQRERPHERVLVIVRPAVVFGEGNRGNVYNLCRQIASKRFVMVGDGLNKKSMVYVGNVAAFLLHSASFEPGVHVYNLVDKPDFSMNELVLTVKRTVARSDRIGFRLPYWFGYFLGGCCDVAATVTRKQLPVSARRVRKFCATSTFASSASATGFAAPEQLGSALERTLRWEFLER